MLRDGLIHQKCVEQLYDFHRREPVLQKPYKRGNGVVKYGAYINAGLANRTFYVD